MSFTRAANAMSALLLLPYCVEMRAMRHQPRATRDAVLMFTRCRVKDERYTFTPSIFYAAMFIFFYAHDF